MTGGGKAAGPGPDDAHDRLRRRILWAMPSGLYVLGSCDAGRRRRNLMTINWAIQVATEPKLLAVGVEAGAVTHGLVAEGGCFALSLIAREDRAIVRRFVKPLDDGGDPDNLGGFAVHQPRTGAPVLARAVAWLDCELRHTLDCSSHSLFVGEIVDWGGDPDGAELLRMEDTRMNYGG